jgi:hypothetical protein
MASSCQTCRPRRPACQYLLAPNERAPLLAHVDGPGSPPSEPADDVEVDVENQAYIEETYDHPVFLRVCHSACIGQQVLVPIRAIITLYLVVTTFVILDYKIEWAGDHSWLAIFWDFSLAAWTGVLVYQVTALVTNPPSLLPLRMASTRAKRLN